MTSEVLHQAAAEMFIEILLGSGSARFRAEGCSMLPAVLPGDLLQIERTPFTEIELGDIVLFRNGSRLFLHRVFERQVTRLITRGDALKSPDAPVDEQSYLGRLATIERNDRILTPSRTTSWFAAILKRSDLAIRALLTLRQMKQRFTPGAEIAEAR